MRPLEYTHRQPTSAPPAVLISSRTSCAISRLSLQRRFVFSANVQLQTGQCINRIVGEHTPSQSGFVRIGKCTPGMSTLNWIGNCNELSRYSRYDMNTLLYLLHGTLLWRGIYAPTVPTKRLHIGEMKKALQREVFGVEVYNGTPVHHAPRCRYGRGQRVADGFDQRRRSRNWYGMSHKAPSNT